jgi:TatA/E family protein of Tat protein translocase
VLGITEIILIASVVILILGHRQLPKIGGYLGNSVRAFRRGVRGVEDERPVRDLNESTGRKDEGEEARYDDKA